MMREFEYTADYVSFRHDAWLKLFNGLIDRDAVRFLEIGSFEGRSAVWWLEHILTHESSRLVCIDPWHACPEREGRFDRNVAATGVSHKIRKIQSISRKALAWFPDGHFDAAYIDGSHEGRDVLLDGLLTLPLLKPGGILLFDDYQWTDAEERRFRLPMDGIDAFLSLAADRVDVIEIGYQAAFRVK